MPKKPRPIVLPWDNYVYDDDAKPSLEPKSATVDLSHLTESFQIAELLKQLGHDDASALVSPVHLLGGFKPAALVEKLLQYSEDCNGPACIGCINGERLPEFIWSYDIANAVNRLVNLRVAGGHVLGILTFPAVGEVCSYPESGEEAPLYLAFLNVFARGFAMNPQYLAANELLTLAGDENFKPENAETTLDAYSEWSDKNPIDIHDEITFPDTHTVSVQS